MGDQTEITPKLLALNYSNFSKLKSEQRQRELGSKATEMDPFSELNLSIKTQCSCRMKV